MDLNSPRSEVRKEGGVEKFYHTPPCPAKVVVATSAPAENAEAATQAVETVVIAPPTDADLQRQANCF
ncbi:MAG: hypothetical protein Q8Q13_00160 [bacterium]|nr:hypothetical protein [bacterium]